MPAGGANRPESISLSIADDVRLWWALFQNAPDALLLVDGDGAIRAANARAAAVFGWDPDDLVGRAVEDLIPAHHRRSHEAARRDYAKAPRTRGMGVAADLEGLRADGSTFPADISISPVETENGRFVVAVVRDVTERESMLDELHRTAAALRRSNKDLEAFAARAAHDLRAPLSTIALTAATLSITWPDAPAEFHETCKRLARGVKALDKQVRGLLELSTARRHRASSAWFPLGDAVATVRQNLEAQLEARDAVLDVGDLPRVHAEQGLVEHVLQNLVGNALRHAKEPPRVHLRAEQVRGAVRVRVEDNGPGVPEGLRKRIFEPFVHYDSDGVGIGLSLCRRIVDAHGGAVGVEDSDLGGASFWFTLPDEQPDHDNPHQPTSASSD